MITYNWSVLELFGDNPITKVRYLLKAEDDENTVETEGYHQFSQGIINKDYADTKEEDLIRWLDKDTTKDDVNIIKLNLENQLKALKNSQKVQFPWETNTFTAE